ncbi:MAG TPA: asparagine synthase (glutamine-hydrolyzing) [Clostridiales bacterium]|nr:asparagine synthase (glutamine-hydrolyzing) [Clostridiales bacterium]
MSGIAGAVNFHNIFEESVFASMLKVLKQRGPDQQGIYSSDFVRLVNARLAVIDQEHGRQPIHTVSDGNEYVLVMDGRIFNANEIRNRLRSLGHTFEGYSDAEVALKSYIEWGGNCLHELNGVFAFALWDKKLERLFFARDRIGVKPFFYSITEDGFVFGSEIKVLLKHPEIKPEIDINSVAEIILIGPGRTPGYGVFINVKELLPGHFGYYSRDGLEIKKYWELTDREHTDSLDDTVEKVRFLVNDSVKRQLSSDVQVCTFLSGGLDSSIISAIADKEAVKNGWKLHTFSLDYVDNEKYFKSSKFQPNSDREYIFKMSRHLNAEHHFVEIDTPELADALYAAVDARDLPGMADVDSSLYLLSKEVKKYATVALSGECSDEIFGGYLWYRDPTLRQVKGFPWAQSAEYRAKFLHNDLKGLIDPQSYIEEKYLSTIKDVSKLPGISESEGRLRELVVLNFKWFMQTLIDRSDRMCSLAGLEVRVPYCDYRIAEYLYSVPWEYKYYNNYEKGLLRKALEGLRPDEVLWRKKSPFPKTHNPSYLKEVTKRMKEIIEDSSQPIHQIVDMHALIDLINTDNPQPWYGQLMTTPQTIAYFLQVNYWLKAYNISIV